jgi:hypothetical protein
MENREGEEFASVENLSEIDKREGEGANKGEDARARGKGVTFEGIRKFFFFFL